MLEAAPPTLRSVKEPVERRLAEVRDCIVRLLVEDFGAVEEVNEYLLEMQGKFLRPTLLLLSSDVEGRSREEAVPLAAVVELVHLATLVHDDAVDHSVRRRGKPTVNDRWTHQVAVIMGDYLYSRAVTEMARVSTVEAVGLLGRAANRMTVGEMRQLTAHDTLDYSEREYELLCECKTASLMAASCELGALYGASDHREALRDYGYLFGMAFQVTDDLLDYTASASVMGKPSGIDLRQHKITLPLIAALPGMTPGERERVEELFADPEPGEDLVGSVVEIVAEAGGLDYARRRAEEYASRARARLRGLPESPAREALGRMLTYVVERRS